jgi:glycosyltransferase involved in cell wall biosynthesis
MGKNKISKTFPLVSVCTPTFNRRPFIPIMFECFKNQTYPKNRIEWIIVDDGTDKIKDLIDSSNIPEIKYFALDKKLSLGAKRNFMHSKTSGSIIVYMDDDDYYPPCRISHAVETLQNSKTALCAGSSELYVYFNHIKKMYQSGPFNPNHATAGTFAFKRELLDITKYNDESYVAEERDFLKNYTIPFVQLEPMKTILVFSHNHNSFDKKKLLDTPSNVVFKESIKKVEDFIIYDYESNIKKFFTKSMDGLLKNYKEGEPSMKPEVLKQIKEIDENRIKMMEEQQKQIPCIMFQEQGKPSVQIPLNEVVNIVNNQKTHIEQLIKKNKELEESVLKLQKKILDIKIENKKEIEKLKTDYEEKNKEKKGKKVFFEDEVKKIDKPIPETPVVKPKLKSDPEVMISI